MRERERERDIALSSQFGCTTKQKAKQNLNNVMRTLTKTTSSLKTMGVGTEVIWEMNGFWIKSVRFRVKASINQMY